MGSRQGYSAAARGDGEHRLPRDVAAEWYIDGGLRSGTNADLAAGTRTLVVIEPLGHLYPREPLDQEPAVVAAQSAVTIGPDPASGRVIGPGLYDRAAWQPAFKECLRQATGVSERLRPAWRTGAHCRRMCRGMPGWSARRGHARTAVRRPVGCTAGA